MSRPRCRRLVRLDPSVTYFKPQGVPLRLLDEVNLTVEGLEAIRLKDLKGLHNGEAARQMGISRPTFERVLRQARHAIAVALVEGKALRVQGGDYKMVEAGGSTMKVAVASDEGAYVSQHFGRAPYYVVFTIEDGKVTGREVRSKGYHHVGAVDGESHQHGHDHGSMVSPVDDCSAVLVGGIGGGAYHSLVAQGIKPVFVNVGLVEEAIADYLAGRVRDDNLCQH